MQQEWKVLCSHAIWVIVGIFLVPVAVIQIGRGFYYLDTFPRFNHVCRWMYHKGSCFVNELIAIFYECPAESVIYVTGVIVLIAVAVNKINT